MHDLWSDVKDALDDALDVRQNIAPPPNFERFNWVSAQNNGLPRASEAERIALWGLCR